MVSTRRLPSKWQCRSVFGSFSMNSSVSDDMVDQYTLEPDLVDVKPRPRFWADYQRLSTVAPGLCFCYAAHMMRLWHFTVILLLASCSSGTEADRLGVGAQCTADEQCDQ